MPSHNFIHVCLEEEIFTKNNNDHYIFDPIKFINSDKIFIISYLSNIIRKFCISTKSKSFKLSGEEIYDFYINKPTFLISKSIMDLDIIIPICLNEHIMIKKFMVGEDIYVFDEIEKIFKKSDLEKVDGHYALILETTFKQINETYKFIESWGNIIIGAVIPFNTSVLDISNKTEKKSLEDKLQIVIRSIAKQSDLIKFLQYY